MGRVAYNDGYDHDPEVYGNGLPGWLLAQLDMQRQQQEGGAFPRAPNSNAHGRKALPNNTQCHASRSTGGTILFETKRCALGCCDLRAAVVLPRHRSRKPEHQTDRLPESIENVRE